MAPTIYHDGVINFGKYKGVEAMRVAREDPGYLHWCEMSGVRGLDEKLAVIAREWASKNRGKAAQVERNAEKTKRARAERGVERAQAAGAVASVTRPAPAPASETNAAWGTW